MNHPSPHSSASFAAVLALVLLQAACSDGTPAHSATLAAASAQAIAVGATHSSQYPAPQGEAEELPAQF